jgi:hypothetical protein
MEAYLKLKTTGIEKWPKYRDALPVNLKILFVATEF